MKTERLLAALLLLSAGVQAQEAVADVEQWWVDPGGQGSTLVGNGQTRDSSSFHSGAIAFFSHGSEVVRERLGAQVFGALGLNQWLEVGAVIPVYVRQTGVKALPIASAGLGNPWLQLKARLLSAPVSLAVVFGFGLPVGSGAALGNGGFEFGPKVQLGRASEQWQWGLELGLLSRNAVQLGTLSDVIEASKPLAERRASNTQVGGQAFLAAMLTQTRTSGPRGELSFRLFAPLVGGPVGAEWQVGARWPLGPVSLLVSAGPGLGGGATTPLVRAYVGLTSTLPALP